MKDTEATGGDAAPPAEQGPIPDVVVRMETGELPRIWMVVFIGFVSIIFAIVWLDAYDLLDQVLWRNDFVASNRWVLPVGVLVFSLLVGLGQKYLNAPTVIHGSGVDAIKGGEAVSYKRFPGTLFSSFASLLSGVAVGPEGPLGYLVQEITGWFESRFNFSKESRTGFMTAALASAYNGIIGSPLFTAVLATEVAGAKKDRLLYLGWNLLAGVIGYFVFVASGGHSFLGAVPFPPLQTQNIVFVVYAIVLGAIGTLLVMFLAMAFQFFGKLMGRFKERVVLRTLVAGAITAVVVYFTPEVAFSGETQIHTIVGSAATFGIATLLLYAVLKILLLAVAFKGGFLGGPTFPILFSCTMIGLAIGLAFPSLPVILLVTCIEGAALTLLLGGPLTAILLVGAVASEGLTDIYLDGLIIVAIVTSMIIGLYLKSLMAKRAVKKGANATSGR
jgi:H+/Cl- antiporter ClcA